MGGELWPHFRSGLWNVFRIVDAISPQYSSTTRTCLIQDHFCRLTWFFVHSWANPILHCLLPWPRNLNDAVFRSDDELVDEQVYVASSTRAAGTSGTSDSDTSRLSMAAHVSGPCWPCVFYPTTRGCMRGDRCAYCHFNHPITMLERRVRKRTRDKIKRKLSEILNPPVDLATWLIVDTFNRSRLRLFLSLSLSLSTHL